MSTHLQLSTSCDNQYSYLNMEEDMETQNVNPHLSEQHHAGMGADFYLHSVTSSNGNNRSDPNVGDPCLIAAEVGSTVVTCNNLTTVLLGPSWKVSCIERRSVSTRPLRRSAGDELVANLLKSRYHDFFFSTWDSCVDGELLPNGTLRDTIFYCSESRISRGAYWLLRHLCFVSVGMLAVALCSVACNSGLRRKAHGWCLACHASCLLGFDLGQVVYLLTISDEVDAFGPVPHLRNTCRNFALPMYFLLIAANCWLTALCFNMTLGFRKLQMVRDGVIKDLKRFLVLSAFAWGLPALMTGLSAYAYEKDDEKRRWFNPSLAETRTCFNEMVYGIDTKKFTVLVSSKPSGTALFYYGPVSILVVVNAICIACTLRKVQFLRRGNSVLHREDDVASRGPHHTQGANSRGGAPRTRNGARATVADAKTIRMYAKMLLMTGIVDMVAEVIGWVTIPSRHGSVFKEDDFFLRDHVLAYRATGYATDCFRAACVVWLAAPDGGYVDTLRRWWGDGERRRGVQ